VVARGSVPSKEEVWALRSRLSQQDTLIQVRLDDANPLDANEHRTTLWGVQGLCMTVTAHWNT
jgi:hypothetical protein